MREKIEHGAVNFIDNNDSEFIYCKAILNKCEKFIGVSTRGTLKVVCVAL